MQDATETFFQIEPEIQSLIERHGMFWNHRHGKRLKPTVVVSLYQVLIDAGVVVLETSAENSPIPGRQVNPI